MAEQPYFERLKDALDGLERCLYDDELSWKYSGSVLQLMYEALIEDISFNTKQESYIREVVLEHIKMGSRSSFLELSSILAYTGSNLQREQVDTSLTHHYDLKQGCPSPFDIAIDLLEDVGVFETGEEIRYYDFGTLGVQNKGVGRSGLLILTDRRIIGVGGFATGLSGKKHKLFYGDLREPYLSTVDFVYLDRVTDIDMKKNELQMKYETEYIVEKDRTFYGPYFFTFALPTSIKAKSGNVKLFITLQVLSKKTPVMDYVKDTYWGKVLELWNQVEIPSDYDRVRLDTFFRHLTFQGLDIQ